MSRIAKQPIDIPEGVDININNGLISIKGPKGEISMDLAKDINIKKDDNKIKKITKNLFLPFCNTTFILLDSIISP